MQWLINRSAQQINKITSKPRIVEIIQQLYMCKSRSDAFKGREDALAKIKEYLTSPADRPLILYGVSGSGKTSVVAKVCVF